MQVLLLDENKEQKALNVDSWEYDRAVGKIARHRLTQAVQGWMDRNGGGANWRRSTDSSDVVTTIIYEAIFGEGWTAVNLRNQLLCKPEENLRDVIDRTSIRLISVVEAAVALEIESKMDNKFFSPADCARMAIQDVAASMSRVGRPLLNMQPIRKEEEERLEKEYPF